MIPWRWPRRRRIVVAATNRSGVVTFERFEEPHSGRLSLEAHGPFGFQFTKIVATLCQSNAAQRWYVVRLGSVVGDLWRSGEGWSQQLGSWRAVPGMELGEVFPKNSSAIRGLLVIHSGQP